MGEDPAVEGLFVFPDRNHRECLWTDARISLLLAAEMLGESWVLMDFHRANEMWSHGDQGVAGPSEGGEENSMRVTILFDQLPGLLTCLDPAVIVQGPIVPIKVVSPVIAVSEVEQHVP